MTVAELIMRLQAFPPDLSVYVWDDLIDVPLEVTEICEAIDDASFQGALLRPRRVGLGGAGSY
jgi:hypothetical protein